MKKLLLFGLIALLLTGCAGLQRDKHYSALADERPFSHFFPAASNVKVFSSIDEASEFIITTQYKLRKTIRLNRDKGLSAKLQGPELNDKNPVVVAYYVSMTNANGYVDLSRNAKDLEARLRDGISVTNVFLVFYQGRAVSISDFYLKEGYRFDSNSQPTNFKFNGKDYKTEYPLGWGLEKAFQYLRKELN